jgi:hypothetical protein
VGKGIHPPVQHGYSMLLCRTDRAIMNPEEPTAGTDGHVKETGVGATPHSLPR